MPELVVRSFAVSMDGFSAAPGRRLEAPFGVTDGIESALKQALAGAQGKEVRLTRGRCYVAPVLAGRPGR